VFAWGEVDNRTIVADVPYAGLAALTSLGDSADRFQGGVALLVVAGATVYLRAYFRRVADNVWEQVGRTLVLNANDVSATLEEPIPPGVYDEVCWGVAGIGATGAQVDAAIRLRFSAGV